MSNPVHQRTVEEQASGPCPACSYDLRGTPQGIDGAFQCPECGRSWVEEELTPQRRASRIPWDCVGCIALNVGAVFLATMVSQGNFALGTIIASLIWLCQGLWIFVRSIADEPETAKFVTTWKMAVIVLASGTLNGVIVTAIGALLRAAEC
ncbi:MAG: hypothetical protein QM783_12965 [Phycisphaerales bacterium]